MEENDNNKIITEDEFLYGVNREDKFCSKEENKEKNKQETKEQIIKLVNKSDSFCFKTKSYTLLNKKLNISMGKEEKKELINKYWQIKPNLTYTFYGKEIKNLHNNENVSHLKRLIGILMVYRKFLTKKDTEKFDNYFAIKIKSNERQYYSKEECGKILYIGGDLKDNLGKMFENEFKDAEGDDLPIMITIKEYDEYEKIECEAYDYCDKIPEHNGFSNFPNVFHQNFPKALSNKVNRIKNNKIEKKEKLLKNEKEEEKTTFE